MNNVTNRLLQLDPTLQIHNEGEWSNTISHYTAFNDAGVECEVGEFLYSMVRILKPELILETGTHKGIGASYMGLALKDNGFGQMETLEFLPEIHAEAKIRIHKIGLQSIVAPLLADAGSWTPPEGHQYNLILLDTEPQTRFAELIKFYPCLNEGGFFFIHDLHSHMHQIENEEHGFAWPFGKIPEEMKDLIKTGCLRPFHFETPRGLTGFYKVKTTDYNWR